MWEVFMADDMMTTRLQKLPSSPGQKILKAADAALWLEGYRFLEETKAIHAAEHARGYADGKAAGAADAAVLLNETVVRVDHYIASLDKQIAELSVNIVRRVLGEMDSKELIAKAAAQALTEFRREKSLKVTVHPEAAEHVRAKLTAHIREADLGITLRVETDPAFTKEACVVASDFAVIDASVEAQIDALAKAIGMAAVERRGGEEKRSA
jgi:type III secretion protein L